MRVPFKYLSAILLIICVSIVFGFKTDQNDELKVSMERGKLLYATNCSSCHMQNGQGLASVFPPLAKSDYLMADTQRAAKQILNGAKGEMKVNGITYNGVMIGFDLTDQEVADILNYIKNSWGNKAQMVKTDEIAKARD